jgi:hypothetical protein
MKGVVGNYLIIGEPWHLQNGSSSTNEEIWKIILRGA